MYAASQTGTASIAKNARHVRSFVLYPCPDVHGDAYLLAAGFQQKVTSYEGLMSLAKSQGLANNATRGACRICGGLGHLTKQCKNGVSGHTGTMDDLEMEAARGERRSALLCTI